MILNWESLTRGPIGISAIPPLAVGGHEFYSARSPSLTGSPLRSSSRSRWCRRRLPHLPYRQNAARDTRRRCRGPRLWEFSPNRYKAQAFAFSGFVAGVSGAITAHLYSYLNFETFTSQISVLALTMVILGGLGNVFGAVVAATALVGLPEIFRVAADYRMLIYGLALLLLIRFRPQGLFGTV